MIRLVLGGTRSGKSEVAESLVPPGPATYVATGVVTDDDMARRIAAHRDRRRAQWTTVEAGPGDVVGAVAGAAPGPVLVDSLGSWVAASPEMRVDGPRLCEAAAARASNVVIVSEEVGLGVHPHTEAGRLFCDRLGELNRLVASAAGEVLLVVAGRVLRLGPGAGAEGG